MALREEQGEEGRGMLAVEGLETAAMGWGGAEGGARRSERVRMRMRRRAEGGGEGLGCNMTSHQIDRGRARAVVKVSTRTMRQESPTANDKAWSNERA